MRLASLCIAALLACAPGVACAQDAVAQFYRGKQVSIIVGTAAGGGYDAYARFIARFYGNHIPGNPSVVVSNMPGAGSNLAAYHVAAVAPKDGTVLLATYNALIPEPLFGNPAVQFDPLKFEWIGSIGKQQNICVTWHTNKIKTIDQAIGQNLTVSSTGATGFSATMGLVLNALIGTKIKVVLGYATNEARLAVERGETDGICGLSRSTLKASNPDWIQNKRLNVLVQTGSKPHYELPDTPLLIDLVKSETDKKVVDLISFSEDMGRPFVMPPGTPEHLVQAVRRGFDATMKDPDFLEDARKGMMEVDPLTGEEMKASLERNYKASPALIKRAAELLASSEKK